MSTDSDNGGFWPAPAKLNLFLHVTGRRPDGYHELQTVFQLLDYGDEIFVETRADGLVLRPEAHAPVSEDEVLALLEPRTGFLDAVVVTGGVAKWPRHRVLIPAFVGSSPTAPARLPQRRGLQHG